MQTPEEFVTQFVLVARPYDYLVALIATRDAEIRRNEQEALLDFMDGWVLPAGLIEKIRARTPASPTERRLPHRDDPATWPAKVRP